MTSEKYKYVYKYKQMRPQIKIVWQAMIWDPKEQRKRQKNFPGTDEGERKAALWVDKMLLQMGREPINILKRL